jgi:hypothetical protein
MRTPAKPMTIAAQMAIAVAILAIPMGEVMAQQGAASPQPSVQSVPLQAPVGHRQPRISDLPPDLAREQRSGDLSKSEAPETSESGTPARNTPAGNNNAGRTLDERLRICRGC